MHRTRTAVALSAAAIALLAITGCSSPAPAETPSAMPVETITPTPTPTQTPTPTPEAEPGTRQAPLALGERQQMAPDSGWIVGLTASNLDAFAAIRAADEYHEPPAEGDRYVVGTLNLSINRENLEAQYAAGQSIENDGLDAYGSLTVEFVGSDGIAYDEFSRGTCYTGNPFHSVGSIYSYDAVVSADVCVVAPATAVDGGLWRISNSRNDSVWIKSS